MHTAVQIPRAPVGATSQAERLRYALELFASWALRLYDAEGNFHPDRPERHMPDERDRCRTAVALLAHGGEAEVALAEVLLRGVFVRDGVDLTWRDWRENFLDTALPGAQTPDWNIFQSNNCCKILAAYPERLSTETREKLERIARRNTQRYAGSAQADYLPRGYNDNMPAGAACGLILGGEAIGDARAVDDGVHRLELFAEQLSRCGLVSEHTSGAYTPITIAEVADIANYSKDAAIRELAQGIEVRLWSDLLMFFHPPTGHLAGAATRAYRNNSLGHMDSAQCVTWIATGLPETRCPFDSIMDMHPGQQTVHSADRWFLFANTIILLAEYHCPQELVDAVRQRRYPFTCRGTSEHGGPSTERCMAQTFQQPGYAMSTRTAPFLDGKQSDVLKVVFAGREPVRDDTDTGAGVARFLANEVSPGDPELVRSDNILAGGNVGLMRAIQHDGLGLLLSRAGRDKLNADAWKGCTSIRQSFCLGMHFLETPEVFVGGERVDALPFTSPKDATLCLNLGGVYAAMFPLTLTRLERDVALGIEMNHGVLTVSFYSYAGEARDFTLDEASRVFNGFVIELADPAAHASFEQFARGWKLDAVEDWWFEDTRRTRVRRGDTELAMLWQTPNNRLKAATVNGRPLPDALFHADGFDAGTLPFLNRPYFPQRYRPAEDSLDIAWYPDMAHQVAAYSGPQP